MSEYRFVREDAVLRVIRSALPTGNHGREAAVAAMTRWLANQPTAPRLTGPTAAAETLGVKPPHITRLKDQGRMNPIPVEGSADVYIKEEVEALASALHAERQARERKRAAKETA